MNAVLYTASMRQGVDEQLFATLGQAERYAKYAFLFRTDRYYIGRHHFEAPLNVFHAASFAVFYARTWWAGERLIAGARQARFDALPLQPYERGHARQGRLILLLGCIIMAAGLKGLYEASRQGSQVGLIAGTVMFVVQAVVVRSTVRQLRRYRRRAREHEARQGQAAPRDPSE